MGGVSLDGAPPVCVLVPTLGRADALRPLVDNLRATTPVGAHSLVFVCDEADTASRDALVGLDATVVVCDGTYPQKVNAGLRACSEPLVLAAADDVVFHPGWWETTVKAFTDGVEVVGCDDLTPSTLGRRHATLPVVRRSYIADPGAVFGEPGILFYEGYHHNFCETELWQLASHRGVTAWSEAVIEHRHPAWGTREPDETDRKGGGRGWERDKLLFQSRRDQWTS